KKFASLASLWRKYTGAALVLTGLFSLSVYALSRDILHWVYGGKFDDLAALLGVMAFVPVVMAIGNTANAALKAIEKPDVVLYGYVASGAVTFLAGIPLVMHFGLRGAVYGMLVSAACYTLTLVASLISLIRKQS